MGLASLTSAYSGMSANKKGLEVVGHNLANVNTEGYSRQQLIQKDSVYNYSYGRIGQIFSVGTGTSVEEVRQVRNSYVDQEFHNESSKYGYYSAKEQIVTEIENIFNETDGEGLNGAMNNLFNSIKELSKMPDSLEARGSFVQNAITFVDRVDYIDEQMSNYQKDLNKQVENIVEDVNRLTSEIKDLNEKIAFGEVNNDNANDFRDQRNLKLNELSKLIDIDYKEDETGRVIAFSEGNLLISPSFSNSMKLVPSNGNPRYLKPIWTNSGTDVYDFSKNIGAEYGNDNGKLKGILQLRGNIKGNHTNSVEDVENSFIPRVQREFDILVNDITTMINDIVAPKTHTNGPKGLDGSQYTEIFTRKTVDRYDGSNDFIPEDPSDAGTLYSAGNIEVNSEIIKNYNKIPLSMSDEKGDNSVVQEIVIQLSEDRITKNTSSSSKSNYTDYFNGLVSDIANEGILASSNAANQEVLLKQINEQRQRESGVSLDEELGEMMKYQHAYSASAKVANVVDKMMETIIYRTGAN